MNLSQLNYFRKLAEIQHYTNAAKALFITQPTLSGAITALESELGIKLFYRNGRNIVLTEEGETFYAGVCRALDELEDCVAEVKARAADAAGEIAVGCLVTLLGDFLPRVIASYHDNVSKEVQISTHSAATSKEILEGVKNGTLDLALGSKIEGEQDIEFFPLYPERIVAVVNSRHPLAGREHISLAELRNYDIMTYQTEMPIGQQLLPLLQCYDIQAQCLFLEEVSIGGHAAIQQVVGLAAETPSLLQFPSLIHLSIDEIPDDFRYVYMAYHKKRHYPPHIRRFIQFIMDNKEELAQKY